MTTLKANPIRSILVSANKPLQYSVAYAFQGSPAGFEYSLISPSPSWLSVDKNGLVTGTTPNVHVDHEQFIVTVQAQLGDESLTEDFIIQVMNEDSIENMTRFMLQLTKHPFSPDRKKHEVLEFLFEYYHSCVYVYDFLHILRDEAKKLGIDLPEKIEYKDFKRVAEAEHPGIEQELENHLHDLHILTEIELSHVEMTKLFKEGGQQLGMLPAVVWNYLGEASYHNWGNLKTVLHEAVHAVKEMREHVKEIELHHQLELRLKPK